MSTGNSNEQGGLPDDFFAAEDARQKEVEHIVQANKLGGYSDKYADFDPTADDEGDEEDDSAPA